MKNKDIVSSWSSGLSLVENSVLKCFFPEAEEMSISDIKKRSGYSYERVYSTLKKLEEKNIVKSNRKRKIILFNADYNHLYLRLAFWNYMTERLMKFSFKYPVLYKALREIDMNSLGIVLVFGSYSKGNEGKNSDIDLMIVSDSSKVEKEINKIKIKYGLNISLVVVRRMEFSKIKKENVELWRDLKNYALIFNHSGLFYYWMYQNENN